jgi:superfamily II DNA/RNA helicase
MNFNTLGLSPKVLDAIAAAGFHEPTPIQHQAIPPALGGSDIIGIAQTGTGKTASFVLPMLTRLEAGRARARMPRSLILEPTRELAAQVAQAFEQLGANHKFTVALLIGGVSFDEQYRKLDRGADVLIATPGRLLDHYGRGKLLLNAVEILVIDEADRMLDMGFIPDIERICGLLPTPRQTLFFSATMPPEIQKLTKKFLNNPERIEVDRQATTASTIIQRLKFAEDDDGAKREVLRELITGTDVRNAIIFCNRKRDVGILYKSLIKHGFNAGALHGDMEQRDRTATLEAFRKGEITFLAASDVAARGLDIPDVSHVFNFDVPISPEDYVHRVGRTGRAGREGFAATIVTPADIEAVRAIEKLCREKIEWLDGEPDAELLESGRGNRRRRGRGRTSERSEAPRARSARGGGSEAPRERPARAGSSDAPRGRSAQAGGSDAPRERSAQAGGSDAPRERPARASGSDRNSKQRGVAEVAGEKVRAGRATQSDRKADRGHSPVTPFPATSQERARPVAAAASRGGRGRNGGQRGTEEAVVGLGDLVPAFLMNPVRRAK